MIAERLVPAVRQLPGFRAGYWMVNRQTGAVVTVFLYDTAEALQATAEQARQMREQATQQIGVTFESVDEFEVIGEA